MLAPNPAGGKLLFINTLEDVSVLHAVDGFAETFFDEQADDCAEEKLRAHLDTERAAEVKGLRDEAGILECCDPCQCSCLRLVGQPQNMG